MWDVGGEKVGREGAERVRVWDVERRTWDVGKGEFLDGINGMNRMWGVGMGCEFVCLWYR